MVAAFATPDRSHSTDRLRLFFSAVRRNPKAVGALTPSSRRLCEQVAAVVPGEGDPVVVELGPGTGSATEVIEQRLAGRGRHLAIELDTEFTDHLTAAFPRVEVIADDAARLGELLEARSITEVDAVISGLPWSLIPQETQRRILSTVTRVLRSDGAFTTFAYLHAMPLPQARAFRRLLHERFDEVLLTHTVWWNVPPAATYVCRRPRRG